MAVAEPTGDVESTGPSIGSRLRARGVDLVIAGEPHRLVFDYEAILVVEEEYGSLQAFLEALTESAGRSSARFKALTWGITASLLHERDSEASPEEIHQLRRSVVRGLASKGINQHFAAMTKAIEEGLPEPDRSANPKGKGSRDVSRGAGSTTSRASASGSTPASSG